MGHLPFQQRQYSLISKHATSLQERPVLPLPILLKKCFVNVNKPAGPSSHMVSEWVQRILGGEKTGHGGTLDPAVTGVLPVAVGRSTRLVKALLTAGKEYVCLMRLHTDVEPAHILRECKAIIGHVSQVPPVKSAVKRVERQRLIYYVEVLEIDGRDVLFRVGCEAGTYIRTLCVELGRRLGTKAHMAELVRTRAGPFGYDTTVTLQDLEDAYALYATEQNERFVRHCLRDMAEGVDHLPKIYVIDSAVRPIVHGNDLKARGVGLVDSDLTSGSLTAIMTLRQEIIALGTSTRNAERVGEEGTVVRVQTVVVRPEELS